jgi:amino acid permease
MEYRDLPFIYATKHSLNSWLVTCSGVFDTLVNLIKIGLGTGVLALPYAASVAGVVGAAICLVVAGAWNYFAVSVMIQCMKQVGFFNLAALVYVLFMVTDPVCFFVVVDTLAQTMLCELKQREKKMGYSALANEAWGKYGLLAVDFALFITLMGAGVAYFVFIETTMIHGKCLKN